MGVNIRDASGRSVPVADIPNSTPYFPLAIASLARGTAL